MFIENEPVILQFNNFNIIQNVFLVEHFPLKFSKDELFVKGAKISTQLIN
jgi:hypothetical protein